MQTGFERPWVVITSVNQPTAAIKEISGLCSRGWSAVVVGDTKTPPTWHAEGIEFLSVEKQQRFYGDLAEIIPYRHYCRKNLGYLYAIEKGADLILDTDDDNIPLSNFGHNLKRVVNGSILKGDDWVNVYHHFSRDNIWPRGLPLNRIHTSGSIIERGVERDCVVQQFLANRDPDIDAIHRLVFNKETYFDGKIPIILDSGVWTPFNSQNTVFFPPVFPLLYLPCYVSFRMTDIWRSFIALALIEKLEGSIAFLPPTVEQIRNEHDLLEDFKLEVDGYLNNDRIRQTLRALLKDRHVSWQSLPEAMVACVENLVEENLIPERELVIVNAWIQRLAAIRVDG
jgi:hypothetical protein